MAIYRSSLNWLTQYNSNKKGYSSALELYPFLRQEATAGVFNPPQAGSQGSSIGGTAPLTDLTSATGDSFQIAVDGTAVVLVTIALTATTGASIAQELETKINAALLADNQDSRVWVEYSDDQYKIFSQTTGSLSSVIIVDASSDNIADELKLGSSNGGTEALGDDSQDWVYVTAASVNFTQEFEKSAHRSGRQASGVYLKKRMCEGNIEMYCLLGANDSGAIYMPDGMKTLLKSVFGNQSVDTASRAVFDMKQPHSTYFSLCQANNVIGQVTNGCYAKTWNLELAGDDAAKVTIDMKSRDSKVTIPSKIDGVSTGAVVSVVAGDENNLECDLDGASDAWGSRVMVIGADGRTCTEGYSGDLQVVNFNTTAGTVTLNRSVTVEDGGFLAPYFPIFGYNIPADSAQISTDLTGTISFDGGSTIIDHITSVSVSVDPQLTDLDAYYGAKTNKGFVDSSRAEISLSVGLHLTGEQAQLVMKAKRFTEFSMKVIVGYPNGQKMIVHCPRVLFSVPAIEIPENGPVEVTLEGQALQTRAGALDAISLEFLAS